MAFSTKLKEERGKRELTQEELAQRAGVSIGTIRNLEQGIRKPSLEIAQKIADALDVSCEAFKEPPAPETKPRKKKGGA